jgi:hypothetical protein
MAQQQANVTLAAPGFMGLNTQDSPLDMDIKFASVAQNCVIDRFGRIASRRGFQYLTSNPTVLGGSPIATVQELVTETGDKYLLAAGANKLWLQQTETPFELVELTLPVAYSIVNDLWQIIPFNDKAYFIQAGQKPLVFDPAVSTTAVDEWAEYPNATTGNSGPNCGTVAVGRLWLGDFDNDSTIVVWSGLLDGENWSSLGVGGIETKEYWPAGFDEVSALAVHNDYFVIFGQRSILLYTTTSDVTSTLNLVDTIEGIGCIARDTVVPTGIDFMFLDATGVRSLMRTIQEKSAPIGDMSLNVRQDIQRAIFDETTGNISGVFHVEDSFYVVFFPTVPKTYVFDTWQILPNGAARATEWLNINPRCGVRTLDRITYFAGDRGVYFYRGSQDITLANDETTEVFTSIPMAYYTHPLDFGSPASLVFPKQVDVVLIGGLQGDLRLNWGYDYADASNVKTLPLSPSSRPAFWGSPENVWGDVESFPDPEGYVNSFWTSGTTINELKYNIWGSGRNVKIGFTADILGSTVSIQEINVKALQGRIL